METKKRYTPESWLETKIAVQLIARAAEKISLSEYLPDPYLLLAENRRTTRKGNRDKYGVIPCFKIEGTNRIIYKAGLLLDWIKNSLIPALENAKQRTEDERRVTAAIKVSRRKTTGAYGTAPGAPASMGAV